MRPGNRIAILVLLTDIALITYSTIVVSQLVFSDWFALERLIYIMNLLWLATVMTHRRRRSYGPLNFSGRLRMISRRWFTMMAMLAIWNQMDPAYPESGIKLFLPGIIFLLLEIPAIWLTSEWLSVYRKENPKKKILIAGTGKTGMAIREYFQANPTEGEVIGFLQQHKDTSIGSSILGSYADLPDVLKKFPVHELIVAVDMREKETIRQLIQLAEKSGIRPVVAADYQAAFHRNVDAQRLGSIPVFRIREVPLDDQMLRIWKRVFDVVFSAAVLMMLSPVLLLIALAIKLDSPGPVFYRPIRIGRSGERIRIFKFRSMKHQSGQPSQKSTERNDERITRVGRFLRRYSLDEIPQFLNVLAGQMSVVGPRPHRPDLDLRFRQAVYTYPVRQYIKPGITGWAQVNGWRGPTETRLQFAARTLHDLWYMEHWSLLLDAAIIVLTLFGRKTRTNAF